MLELISNKDEWICSWVAERLPGYLWTDFQPCSTLGIKRDGRLLAGIVFNNFRPKIPDIHLTIVADSPRWATRQVFSFIFSYVFNQLGCIRMTVTIGKKNKRSRRLAEGVGFQYEGKLRKGIDGTDDAILYGMLSTECKWLGESNGRQKHAVRA